MSIDKLFKKVPAATSSKKKSDIQEFELPNDIRENVNRWLEGKRKITEGEALIKSSEPELVDFAFDKILTESIDSKSVVKSVRLIGEKNKDQAVAPKIRITQAAKFLKINPDNIDVVKQAFPQQFDDFFEESRTVSINVEKLIKNPDLLAKVEKALDAVLSKDESILETQTSYTPKEFFITQIMTNKAVQRQWKQLTEEGICKLQKPSVYAE